MSTVKRRLWDAGLLALVDFGATGNVIEQALASYLNIPSYPLSSPCPVQALDSQPLGSGTHTHQEKLSFRIISAPVHKIVLGLEWLYCQNSAISWPTMKITVGTLKCRKTYFSFPCGSMSVESPVVALQPNIPEVYQDLQEFFPQDPYHRSSLLPLRLCLRSLRGCIHPTVSG